MNKKYYILADIGGTHFRYSILRDGVMSAPVKMGHSDYPDLCACFEYVMEKEGLNNTVSLSTVSLAIATTGAVDLESVQKSSFDIKILINDFEASARGAMTLTHEECITLYKGTDDERYDREKHNKMVCGPGTGLGLAYAIPIEGDQFRILRTSGGHFVICAQTDEHSTIIDLVRRIKNKTEMVTFEDIVSGRGLPHLYKAVSMIHGVESDILTNADILDQAHGSQKEMSVAQETLRLFHEFFGLFVHTTTITGHALGGVYLDGGVIQALHDKALFRPQSFFSFMHLNSNDTVRERLKSTPVYLIDTPFVALHGLKNLLEKREKI